MQTLHIEPQRQLSWNYIKGCWCWNGGLEDETCAAYSIEGNFKEDGTPYFDVREFDDEGYPHVHIGIYNTLDQAKKACQALFEEAAK
jgi:hypothetical protein